MSRKFSENMISSTRQPCDMGVVINHYYVCVLTHNRCVWCGHVEGSDLTNSFEREEEEI